jgi:hypothetical protein
MEEGVPQMMGHEEHPRKSDYNRQSKQRRQPESSSENPDFGVPRRFQQRIEVESGTHTCWATV